MVILDMLVVTC
jgi:hypothetical protein